MKKIGIIFLLFIFNLPLVFSQDIIVSTQGDTIPCKIFKKKYGYLYYGHLVNNKPVRSTIDLTYVSFYQTNYYNNRDVVKHFPGDDWGRVRLAGTFNYSYRLASIDKNASEFDKNYYKKLKSGYGYSVDFSYMFTKYIGVGFLFNRHNSYYRIGDVDYFDVNGNYVLTSDLSTRIAITYIGPQFYFSTLMAKGKIKFHGTASVGLMMHKENWKAPYDVKITGDTIGYARTWGIDFKISPSASIGITASMVLGALGSVEIDDGRNKDIIRFDENEYQSIAHINIGAGIRFYFSKRAGL